MMQPADTSECRAEDQVAIVALQKLEVCWTICGGVIEECWLFGGQLSNSPHSEQHAMTVKYASSLFSSSRQSEVIRSLSAGKYVLVQSSDEACRPNHKKNWIVTRNAQ